MTCIYSNFNGECTLADRSEKYGMTVVDPCTAPEGCDEQGYCMIEDDPHPEDSCAEYEEVT